MIKKNNNLDGSLTFNKDREIIHKEDGKCLLSCVLPVSKKNLVFEIVTQSVAF